MYVVLLFVRTKQKIKKQSIVLAMIFSIQGRNSTGISIYCQITSRSKLTNNKFISIVADYNL